jgi:hypothetical protein
LTSFLFRKEPMKRTTPALEQRSAHAEEWAALAELGLPLEEQRERFTWQDALRTMRDLLLLILSGWALSTYLSSLPSLSEMQLILSGVLLIPLLAFFLLIVVLLWLDLCMFHQRRSSLIYCEKGLIYYQNNLVKALRWDQIIAVSFRKKTWSRYLTLIDLVLSSSEGERFVVRRAFIHELFLKGDSQAHKRFEALCKRIEQEVVRYLLPRLLVAHSDGIPLSFGKLTINKWGLSIKDRFLPWSEVQNMTYAPSLSIWQVGQASKWACLPCEQIPNLAVFKAFVDYFK